MKLTTGIVVLALSAGACWAQSSAANSNTKTTQPTASTPAAKAKPSAATVQTGPKPAVISISPVAMPTKPAAAPAKTANTTAKPVPATATTTAKPAVVPAKTTPAAKPALIPAKTTTAAVKPAVLPAKTTVAKPDMKVLSTKTATPATKTAPASAKAQAAAVPAKTSSKPVTKIAATPASPSKDTNATSSEKEVAKNDKPEDKKYSMTGKRDPFISPVVNRSMGSGCSTGKKCLDIEQIALHGVVKSDNGMIAVVTNGLNKAYFLRENDPVFNGYVVKITVDSIVFKQTLQDRLGKPFTKDVVKRILTPAV
jgi:Tfp pilus assembly protein PilP